MTRRFVLISVFCISVSITGHANGVSSKNPYQPIVDRNVFGLHRNQREIVVPPPAQQHKVKLLGITTVLPHKRVILRVQFPAGPGEGARDQTLILEEHQRTGEIEVLEIDERAETVRLSISGTLIVAAFEQGNLPGPYKAATIELK
jgi:hypothetical protein